MTESPTATPKALPTATSIVVGIDGSKAALRAALWAVDEAVSRDVPIRLCCAVDRGESRRIAETSLHQAVTAIHATGVPVKTETDVVRGRAIGTLIRASASAAMVCVGAVGLRHFHSMGSTAAALASSAHCPVAIIRGRDGHRLAGRVVVEVAGPFDNAALLGAAIEEALLRGAWLRVVGGADLDRRLTQWKRRYPQLRVESEAATAPAGLVIVDARNRERVAELIGPVGGRGLRRSDSALREADCSLLIVNRQHL
jgi:nucleotide-binding universal stress UspA family protein